MKYFLGFLASIGLIILVFILILKGFGGKSPQVDQNPLSDYANTNALVRITVDGPIISQQQHQAYRITVGRSEARIETLQGYQYDAIETKTYENTQQGYNNFLRALDLAGFTKGDKKAANNDERGVCATGNRYIYEIINGTSEVQRYWGTSCGGAGTFKGDKEQVNRLFNRQIPTPDFSRLTSRLKV